MLPRAFSRRREREQRVVAKVYVKISERRKMISSRFSQPCLAPARLHRSLAEGLSIFSSRLQLTSIRPVPDQDQASISIRQVPVSVSVLISTLGNQYQAGDACYTHITVPVSGQYQTSCVLYSYHVLYWVNCSQYGPYGVDRSQSLS